MRPLSDVGDDLEDMLHRQIELIIKSIGDLDRIRDDMPQHRRLELDVIIERLQVAAQEDQWALADRRR